MTGKLHSFNALHLANEQRSSYGLRYHDFNRYRKHCAHRTHRLRSSLQITHGKGRDFKNLPHVSSDRLKDGHLQLLLLEAERAWAYSQELFSLSLQPGNERRASKIRHSATGRFRRAINWSTQLLSHCRSLFVSSRLSAENILQVYIYTLMLNGRFLRYRDDFGGALIQLSVARYLLDELAATASTSRDQALATLFADEIGPEIRYCAHELGHSKAYDVDGMVNEIASRHMNEIVEKCDMLVENFKMEGEVARKGEVKTTLGILVWEGQTVHVRNPELVDVLLKVQDAEARLNHQESGAGQSKTGTMDKKVKQSSGSRSKKGVAAFDSILLALSDAEEVARKLEESQQMNGVHARSSTAGTRDIQFLHAYIIYQLLSRRIQRDLFLVSALLSSQRPTVAGPNKLPATSKLRLGQVDGRLYPAVVKLLDTVLQSLDQMRTLSIVDESQDLASAVEVRLSFTKSRRCLNLAYCYEPVKKYAEALSLIQHAGIHLRDARCLVTLPDSDPITSGNPPYYTLSNLDFDQLESNLSTHGLRLKRDWFAHNGGSTKVDNKSYKKPLFFNIALNYVQLDVDHLQERSEKESIGSSRAPGRSSGKAPELQSEKKQMMKAIEDGQITTSESQAPARSGLSSLLGGWWGRS